MAVFPTTGSPHFCALPGPWDKLLTLENTKGWQSRAMMGILPGGSVVKTLPAMQETQVRSLGREDPLEEEMATHSSILAWEIPWTEEPGRL